MRRPTRKAVLVVVVKPSDAAAGQPTGAAEQRLVTVKRLRGGVRARPLS